MMVCCTRDGNPGNHRSQAHLYMDVVGGNSPLSNPVSFSSIRPLMCPLPVVSLGFCDLSDGFGFIGS